MERGDVKVTIEITPEDELVLRRQRGLHGISIKRQLEMAARVYCSESEPCRTYFDRVAAMDAERSRVATEARSKRPDSIAGSIEDDDDDDGDMYKGTPFE